MPNKRATTAARGEAALDWAGVRKRLEDAAAGLDENRERSPEENRRILKSRALALAQETGDGREAGERVEIVEFLLAAEHYATESRHVREVFSLRDLTPLPCTPPHILGITNLRGQIIAIIDLKRFFEIPAKGLAEFNKVLLIQTDQMEVGLLADAVLGVRVLAREEVHPPPTTFTGVHAEFVQGVTRDRLVVLDAAKMLADNRIMVHEEVES